MCLFSHVFSFSAWVTREILNDAVLCVIFDKYLREVYIMPIEIWLCSLVAFQ